LGDNQSLIFTIVIALKSDYLLTMRHVVTATGGEVEIPLLKANKDYAKLL